MFDDRWSIAGINYDIWISERNAGVDSRFLLVHLSGTRTPHRISIRAAFLDLPWLEFFNAESPQFGLEFDLDCRNYETT